MQLRAISPRFTNRGVSRTCTDCDRYLNRWKSVRVGGDFRYAYGCMQACHSQQTSVGHDSLSLNHTTGWRLSL